MTTHAGLRWRRDGGRDVTDVALLEPRSCRLDVERLSDDWMQSASDRSGGMLANATERTLDVLTSVALLALTLPLMLLTALLVKLDSRGPVFYFQERVG